MIPINDLLVFAAVVLLLGIVVLLSFLLGNLKRHFGRLHDAFQELAEAQEEARRWVREDISKNREEIAAGSRETRYELRTSLKEATDSLLQRATENAGMQKDQLDSFGRLIYEMTRHSEEKLESMRKTVEERIRALQEDNRQKLEQMRQTVDEQLQTSLEKRLSESFKQVSERLEQVYRGLGEMQTLAAGVGDLKKVLTNVKTRGMWGEIRLANILEQILTPDQYDVNVATRKESNERVEFAVKLPGRDPDQESVVYLPIDSKFPQEDYQRLVEAQEQADKAAMDVHLKRLESRIKQEARWIREKYIDPPNTTDFGILFLPVEGLYAEVLRLPGLCDTLQREYRIVVCGPTTLSALLNSLQMGFKTLAIERRSSEVWRVLGGVKNEFAKFGEVLTKTKKKLQEAASTIDQAEVRTRAIERQLKDVQELPPPEV